MGAAVGGDVAREHPPRIDGSHPARSGEGLQTLLRTEFALDVPVVFAALEMVDQRLGDGARTELRQGLRGDAAHERVVVVAQPVEQQVTRRRPAAAQCPQGVGAKRVVAIQGHAAQQRQRHGIDADRADGARRGATGLGLAIGQHLAQCRHGGPPDAGQQLHAEFPRLRLGVLQQIPHEHRYGAAAEGHDLGNRSHLGRIVDARRCAQQILVGSEWSPFPLVDEIDDEHARKPCGDDRIGDRAVPDPPVLRILPAVGALDLLAELALGGRKVPRLVRGRGAGARSQQHRERRATPAMQFGDSARRHRLRSNRMNAPAKEPHAGLTIRSVPQPARFLDLQRDFYRGDPNYVPPITMAEAWAIDRRKNPFFAHADVEFFAAITNGRCVGRISACRDRLHDEFHGDHVGFFGHFEARDAAVAKALVDHAAQWCRTRGADQLRGPIDLSTNYRCGLLVDGDIGPPVVMMPYNPPQYGTWLEGTGLAKAKDLLALHVTQETIDLRRVDRIADHLRKKTSATLRPIDLKRFDAECDVLWDLYHRIWERNWGFVPMTQPEFLAQAKDLKKIAHPALMHIAEVAGAPVGFVVALPDVNVAARACKGRLLPLGWLHFLRAMKKIDLIRVITLGIVPEWRRVGIEMLLMHQVIRAGLDAGFRACEASWILEDNHEMLSPLATLGHRVWRRYRIYEKSLR